MNFKEFLEEEKGRPSRKCSICQNEVLADEIRTYVAGRLDGSISYSINYVWEKYFGPKWNIGSPNTIRNHIRRHLGHDL